MKFDKINKISDSIESLTYTIALIVLGGGIIYQMILEQFYNVERLIDSDPILFLVIIIMVFFLVIMIKLNALEFYINKNKDKKDE